MNRILVVNVNWLGDAIMTTPAFKAIKEKFPLSFVAVMAPERVKDVFSGNPYIDEVIIFDEKNNPPQNHGPGPSGQAGLESEGEGDHPKNKTRKRQAEFFIIFYLILIIFVFSWRGLTDLFFQFKRIQFRL